jgi:hypothetical protein
LVEESEFPGENSPFDFLGIDESSVDRFLHDKARYDRSKQVCICGHAINKHHPLDDKFYCLTARHWCPCRTPNPVVVANDTRYFMRKTYGPGSRHALSTGLRRVRQVGKKARWIDQPECWNPKCPKTNHLIFPVALNDLSQPVAVPSKINVLLCETCYLGFAGTPGNEGKGWIW